MSKADEIRTYIRNAYGLSDEDVTNVMRLVSEAVAEQMPKAAPAAPPDVATKDYVQAYVEGALSSSARQSNGPLWWALDTLMRDYEDGGTFEDLSADILRIVREGQP